MQADVIKASRICWAGFLGVLASLAALSLCFAAFVQASERALDVTRERALGICAGALCVPFALLMVALV